MYVKVILYYSFVSEKKLTRKSLAPTLVYLEMLCKTEAMDAWRMGGQNTVLTLTFREKSFNTCPSIAARSFVGCRRVKIYYVFGLLCHITMCSPQ